MLPGANYKHCNLKYDLKLILAVKNYIPSLMIISVVISR